MDWKKTLAAAAPGLATALGGPLAGGVVSILADKLLGGSSGDAVADEAKLAGVLAGGVTPELRAKILDAEAAFKLEALKAGVREQEIAAEDRASARTMQVANKSPMPAILTCGAGLAFTGTLATLFFLPVPATNRDLVVYLVGQLSGVFASCVAFWVGTTRSSENKTAMLAGK